MDLQPVVSSSSSAHARTSSSNSPAMPVRTSEGHIRWSSSASNGLRGSTDSRVESSDTHDSAGSGDRLLENHDPPDIPPIRDGEQAPPYFEFQENSPQGASPPTSRITGSAPEITVSTLPPASPRVGLGLPNPLRRFFSRGVSHSEAMTENRPHANTSVSLVSSTLPDATEGSLSRTRSHSRPGSLGSSLTRPLTNDSSVSVHSRHRSGSFVFPPSLNRQDPNSSQTSVGSLNISAPLTHTTTRTQFSFPKAGPTPEQLKFVSSRESLGRFGVPYGNLAKGAYPNKRPPPFEGSEDNPDPPSLRGPSTSVNWWQKLMQPASEFSTPEAPNDERAASGSGDHRDEVQPNGGESDGQSVHEMTEISRAPGSSLDPTSIPLPLSRGGTHSSRASSQLPVPSRQASLLPNRVSLDRLGSELRDVREGESLSSPFHSVPLTPVSINGG